MVHIFSDRPVVVLTKVVFDSLLALKCRGSVAALRVAFGA